METSWFARSASTFVMPVRLWREVLTERMQSSQVRGTLKMVCLGGLICVKVDDDWSGWRWWRWRWGVRRMMG